MFVGHTIRSVVYGEVKYTSDNDGNNIHPEPYYKTKYSEIDTLDHSVYFRTDSKTIHVFWDNTFAAYGLKSAQIELTETTNEFEQKWEVSTDTKWLDFIGQIVVDFRVIWGQVSTSSHFEIKGNDEVYPQTFEIKTDNGKSVVLSAAELKEGVECEIYPLMDNLLITTNLDMARQLKLI